MKKYDTFKFSINVQIHPETLEDLELAMTEACNALDFHYKTSERIYKEANITAYEKFKLIMKQVTPLMEAYSSFKKKQKDCRLMGGISTFISRPSIEFEGSYDFYKVLLQENKKSPESILCIDTTPSSQNGRPQIEVNSIVGENSNSNWGKFLLKTENPFSCWEEWKVFDKLKTALILMLKTETQKYTNSTKEFLDFEKNLGAHN